MVAFRRITNVGNIFLILSIKTKVTTALSMLNDLHNNRPDQSRRYWIGKSIIAPISLVGMTTTFISKPSISSSSSAAAATYDTTTFDEKNNNAALPPSLRKRTALAPLGSSTATIGGAKLTNLTPEKIASILTNDLVNGAHGQGGYFISGDLTPEIFRDDCDFVDPTNAVSSLARYRKALGILFDPDRSVVELIGQLLPIESDSSGTMIITGKVKLQGVLRLPWKPYIAPQINSITYTLVRGDDNNSDDSGYLIAKQEQTWSISAWEALQQTFTPGGSSVYTSPSNILPLKNEPTEIRQLFDLVNGRRPFSYTPAERRQIDDLIDRIVEMSGSWNRDLLPGTWKLAYLQPGPGGAGVDRRVPFPELPFNDNYQKFTDKSVVNVGEILGPALRVRVSGGLTEVDEANSELPKRFLASIEKGDLCAGGSIFDDDNGMCLPLPIKGEGLFDGVYLGERIRIGQNINGGGARVVQVKML